MSKEHAYAYESGYQDGLRAAENENAKLRDENARLLSCLTDDAENARQILGESRALQAENAKLRELVRGLHAAYVGMTNQYEGDEESLIWEYSGSIETDMGKLRSECDEARHRFDVALRELGVEVDG